MKNKLKISNYKYHIGCILLIAVSILLAVFVFKGAYIDLGKACVDSWNYLKQFFSILFADGELDTIVPPSPPPTPAPPTTPSEPTPVPPTGINQALLLAKFRIWGLMFITGDSYKLFAYKLSKVLMVLTQIALVAIPVGLILWKLIKHLFFKPNTKHGQKTLPLKNWLTVSKYSVVPVNSYTRGLIEFVSDSTYTKPILMLIWLLNINALTIIISFIPFYFYFCTSLDFPALWNQIVGTILALRYMALLTPIVIVPVVLYYIDKWRQSMAVNKLERLERKNKDVLEKREISTIKWGPMGTMKTFTLSDQALSLSVMFTEKAEELKDTCKNMFPFFPWLLFELDIEQNIVDGKLYNWAGTKEYVIGIENEFNYDMNDLYKYDYKKYGMDYWNGIAKVNLWTVLQDYARLHFLYVIQGSFIISNYSIRENKVKYTVGNTIRYDNSFYRFEKDDEVNSYYSRILNFDILRMCKTFEEAKVNTSLEFGIICITEADKEQENDKEIQNDSKQSPYPTPRNDGIAQTEKFIRHRATIMGQCFVAILKDSQRVVSVNIDSRQLATLERMLKPSDYKSALPFFWIDRMIFKIVDRIYQPFNKLMEFNKGNQGLIQHTMTWLHKKVYDHTERLANKYNYRVIQIEYEAGIEDGETTIVKYYLCNAKMFADRYNTATHENFFEMRALESETGITQYESYGATTMTDEEFDKQNSYSRKNMTNPEWKKEYIDKAKTQEKIKNKKDNAIAKKALQEAKEKGEI